MCLIPMLGEVKEYIAPTELNKVEYAYKVSGDPVPFAARQLVKELLVTEAQWT
jgi:hypothetical protein